MGSRLKEDERNEKTIRALLRQSENRKCINCGSLGPQYVCTTFSIFVCTNCSGLHREFSHRIKSVSMAKFAAEEVRNLQSGGNERAREVFLKEFDLQRRGLPDSSNADKLRDFIKAVYVERRYAGERSSKGRLGDREASHETRQSEPRPDPRFDTRGPRGDYYPDSRSTSFEDRHDDRRFVERRRSDVDRGRYDDRKSDDRVVRFEEKRSPGRFEPDRSKYDQKNLFDDPRQDDRNRYDERDQRASYDDPLAHEICYDRRRSGDDRLNLKDFDGDSPPVRPVTEILGENVPALWVEDCHQMNGDDDRSSLGSPGEQRRDIRVPRLESVASMNGSAGAPSSVAIKRVNSGSLIDFSMEPEPFSAIIPAADPFGVSTTSDDQSSSISVSTGWATFDRPLPTTAFLSADGPPAGYPDVFSTHIDEVQWCASTWPSSQAPSAPNSDNWSSITGSSVTQPVMAAGSQVWKSFPPATGVSASQSFPLHLQSELLHEPSMSSGLNSASADSRELPQELFALSFPTSDIPIGVQGMTPQIPGSTHGVLPFGPLGRNPTHGQPSRSRNPFDLPGDAATSIEMVSFPSLGALQAALPSGPLSLPVSGPFISSNQWPVGLQPASYAPTGSTGGSGSSGQLDHTRAFTMPPQSMRSSLLLSESANFGGGPVFNPELSSLGGLRRVEFSSQDFLYPVAGNPFG